MSTDNPPTVSSGDLREDVAAALLQSDMDDGNGGLYADDYDRLASAAVAAVRAHDAAHPEPWQVTLIQALIAWGPGERAALILADIPAPVRAAAGLT